MGLFHLQEEAAGSVFWHPKGQILYRLIENYIRNQLNVNGYQEVRTPQLFKQRLFEQSGHLDHYKGNMFAVEDLMLKPMNCPAHVQIFKANSISYKQLPMRLAEFGCCHRNEASGALHGIMRLRQFVQDDAHIFCEKSQIEDEVVSFCDLLKRVYHDFGFDHIEVAISLRPENRAGDDALWDEAEEILERSIKQMNVPYLIQEGEGAFYGPKLEFSLRDSQGRLWQCGTLQLDFVLPQRLGAKFINHENRKEQPVMIHRAILGSMERFIGILLEHYGGHLPDWLSPLQVVVVPVSKDNASYAEQVVASLKSSGRRALLDAEDVHMMDKIKKHSSQMVPHIIVVGNREEADQSVALRRLGANKPEMVSLLDLHQYIRTDP